MTNHVDRHGLPIAAGYRMYTGKRMTQADADAYNRISDEIDAATYPATIDFLKDQRHRLLVLIAAREEIANASF